ncbi:hypothetical protein AB0M54_22615 [Actinoplanes sp. NPDC051470]|uniref:hypothetical protein n=1 Tax=unclassified Actinoplanes TaxID=2626549 RepID=UPI0034184A40
MATKHSFRGLLHGASHRVPGVPAHVERAAGHQGTTDQGRSQRPLNRRRNHSPARPPRFLAAWQRRVAAFFGQER